MAMLAVIFAILALAGLLLTLRVLFPKRRGDTPYCAKCRYNLTGIDLGDAETRCPECGAHLALATALIRGERRRSPRRIALAICCVLLGAAPLAAIGVGALRQVDWYQYKPTTWVLADVESDNAQIASKAVQELRRRWKAGELTSEQLSDAAEACMAEQARSTARPRVGVMAANLLDELYVGDCLTGEQTERFFAQMVQFSPLIRPVVVHGQPFYAGVRLKDRGPVNRYRVRVRLEGINLGESPRESFRASQSYRGYTGFSEHSLGWVLDVSPRVGKHLVEADLTVEIDERDDASDRRDGPFPWVRSDSALYSGRRTVTGALEIIPEEPEDLFRMTHSPELDQVAAGRISVSKVYVVRDEGKLRGHVHFPDPHTIGLAFDMFADFNGQRINLGRLTASKDDQWGIVGRGFSFPLPAEIPREITIILRSSKDAALLTPDLYEIWDGELWFGEVQVVEDAEPPKYWGREGSLRAQVRRRDLSEGQTEWPVAAERDYWPAPTLSRCTLPHRGPVPSELLEEIRRSPPGELSDQALDALVDEILSGRAERGRRFEPLRPTSLPTNIGTMSPEEREAYFGRMVEFSLLARPRVVAGQEFFVGVSYTHHAPRDQFDLRVKVSEIRVGDARTIGVERTLRLPLGMPILALASLGKHIQLDEPGTWTVQVDMEFQIYDQARVGTWGTDGPELYSAKLTLCGEVEVLNEEPPDLFRLTHSPEVDHAVAAAVRAAEFRPEGATWINGRAQPGLTIEVWFHKPLPIGLAFEAYAEFGGRQLKAERAVIQSSGGRPGGSHGVHVTFPHAGEAPESATLVLRSSKSAATRTPDLYEIWDGELRFENIPVSEESGREPRFRDGRYAPEVRRVESPQV